MVDTATRKKIPCQLSAVQAGGTDGGQIHLSYGGCPTVVLGVPVRHIHSHVGVLSTKDIDQCIALTVEVVKRLDADTVAGLTAL